MSALSRSRGTVCPRTASDGRHRNVCCCSSLIFRKGGHVPEAILGPGDESFRNALQTTIAANPAAFNKASTKVYPKWWSCHTEKWLDATKLEELDLSELKTVAVRRFDEFLNQRLPAMQSVIDTIVARKVDGWA